jgi:glycosyltransferase involved in cell wall biosynthesis
MDLLVAYSRVNSSNKSLIFVGDGELRPSMEKFVEANKLKNVHFVGLKGQTEIKNYYSMADIFVLPSEWDTTPLVVNEAMCFELPLILSDGIGTARDRVILGENGFIYPVGDTEKLSQDLLVLIGSGEKRKLFGKRSREIVSKLSYDTDISGLVLALDSLNKNHDKSN